MTGTPTPMLAAVYRGDLAAVDRLLADGGVLTLYEAAALGDAARVREALRREPAALRGLSPDGWPALHLAAHFGHGDTVDALLAAGADVALRSDNHEANTPLHAALAGRGDVRIVSALLARGSDVNAPAGGGFTPLHIAAARGDAALVEPLLVRGARTEARAADGRTPLALAEARGHGMVARQLMDESRDRGAPRLGWGATSAGGSGGHFGAPTGGERP